MNIALDYDDTYTRDPEFWNRFINMCWVKGHYVCICTCRGDNEHERIKLVESGDIITDRVPVFYTDGQAKREYMTRVGGILIHVWIDDMPDLILEGPIAIG